MTILPDHVLFSIIGALIFVIWQNLNTKIKENKISAQKVADDNKKDIEKQHCELKIKVDVIAKIQSDHAIKIQRREDVDGAEINALKAEVGKLDNKIDKLGETIEELKKEVHKTKNQENQIDKTLTLVLKELLRIQEERGEQ